MDNGNAQREMFEGKPAPVPENWPELLSEDPGYRMFEALYAQWKTNEEDVT